MKMETSSSYDPRQGISGPLDEWLEFNAFGAFALDGGLSMVAPFPPPELMMETSGLQRPQDFAAHGLQIGRPFVEACPVPLSECESILDFGIGVGRLARMFKGFAGTYVGVDIDRRNIDWITDNLDYVAAVRTIPRRALPFGNAFFDTAFSVSVFTHMNPADCMFYLGELKRVVKPGGYILVSLQGERALQRARDELQIREMLCMSPSEVLGARADVCIGSGYCFVPMNTHLTSENYEYGMTFVSEGFVERNWGSVFSHVRFHRAVIADFQDIAVFQIA
jgi:SAM-dependent methyltransferase